MYPQKSSMHNLYCDRVAFARFEATSSKGTWQAVLNRYTFILGRVEEIAKRLGKPNFVEALETPLYQNFNGIFMDSKFMANGCIKSSVL